MVLELCGFSIAHLHSRKLRLKNTRFGSPRSDGAGSDDSWLSARFDGDLDICEPVFSMTVFAGVVVIVGFSKSSLIKLLSGIVFGTKLASDT